MDKPMVVQFLEAGPLDGKEIEVPETLDRIFTTEWSGNCMTIAPKPGVENDSFVGRGEEPRIIDVPWVWTGRISSRGARVFERERSKDVSSGEV